MTHKPHSGSRAKACFIIDKKVLPRFTVEHIFQKARQWFICPGFSGTTGFLFATLFFTLSTLTTFRSSQLTRPADGSLSRRNDRNPEDEAASPDPLYGTPEFDSTRFNAVDLPDFLFQSQTDSPSRRSAFLP